MCGQRLRYRALGGELCRCPTLAAAHAGVELCWSVTAGKHRLAEKRRGLRNACGELDRKEGSLLL
eukprot:1161013-Pelagomonas_calceolata.AAC.9